MQKCVYMYYIYTIYLQLIYSICILEINGCVDDVHSIENMKQICSA